jgi:hypothetical protein
MKHEEIRHKLSEYIDGAITRQERAAIDEHLTSCATCSDALAELQKTVEQVRQIEEVEAPPWMTQEIMANVRAEAEDKKGLFRRLFYPLAVKLPIQAVAVLFLTVTVYYIYSSIHPADKYVEAPMGRPAKQEAPDREQDAAKRKAAEVPAEREKKVAQEPGYKSLDMKYEYKKPAPPVPAAPSAGVIATRDESAASSPANRTAPQPEKYEATREERPAAPKAAAHPMMKDQAAPKAGAATRAADTATAAVQAKEKGLQASTCLLYEPDVSILNGVITKKDFPEPPGNQDISREDKKETYWILMMDKPFCVQGKKDNSINVSEANISDVQLVLESTLYDKYRTLLGKRVTVKGTLFHSITGHHHTKVLVTVLDIALP